MPKNFAEIAAKHGGTSEPAPNQDFPPSLERVREAVDVRFKQGKPERGYGGGDVIASVAENEPHVIEINNPQRYAQGKAQINAHELTHLWRNQLPPSIRKAAMPVDQNHPYDIESAEKLRSQGHNLATVPEEMAAAIVQRYIALPAERKRWQPWIDDMGKVPLSSMQPTGPNDKTINMMPRAPIPPVEAYAQVPKNATSSAQEPMQIPKPDVGDTMVIAKPKGLIEPGNLPIWNRPVIKNADGSHSTEYTTSFQDEKGREVLVPTVVNGKFLTPDGKKPREKSPEEKAMFKAAWQHYLKTGENLGKFDNPKDADAYSFVLHNRGRKPQPKK